MADLSRRKLLQWTAMAPLAGASAVMAEDSRKAKAKAQSSPPTLSDQSRQQIQRLHLPNIPMITQDGKQVQFYDDLIKNKVVSLNFFFAKCDEICPLVMANLSKVQKLLGSQLGRDIYMYSFTLKPEEDTVAVLKHHHDMYEARPGWTFLTADPKDMEKLRVAVGFTYPDPVIDKDTTQHIGNIRYGNERLMLWSACPGMAHAKWIAETLQWAINPEQNRLQPA